MSEPESPWPETASGCDDPECQCKTRESSWTKSQEGVCDDCGKKHDRVIKRIGTKPAPLLCDECQEKRATK